MRVKEWVGVNEQALESIVSSDISVRLFYRSDDSVVSRVNQLAEAENGCCGAAGVEFVTSEEPDSICVTVNIVRDGAPARTVIKAFSEMKPDQSDER